MEAARGVVLGDWLLSTRTRRVEYGKELSPAGSSITVPRMNSGLLPPWRWGRIATGRPARMLGLVRQWCRSTVLRVFSMKASSAEADSTMRSSTLHCTLMDTAKKKTTKKKKNQSPGKTKCMLVSTSVDTVTSKKGKNRRSLTLVSRSDRTMSLSWRATCLRRACSRGRPPPHRGSGPR